MLKNNFTYLKSCVIIYVEIDFIIIFERMIIIKEVIIFLEANDFKINVNGFINNDEIIFNNDNIDYKFDINSLLFVRKSDEFTSLLDFNNKESIYYLNELVENSKIFSKIRIKQLIKEDTSYIINYRVNEEDFCFKLSYKEVNL